MEPILRIEQGAVCNLSRIVLGTHTSTHIDAPWHFNPEGKRLHQISLARLIGHAWVADLQGYPRITASALEQARIPIPSRACLLKLTTRHCVNLPSFSRPMWRSLPIHAIGSSNTVSMSLAGIISR
ncbi:MAG: hypothetical protein C4336_09535 [Armatimonadota bacterium]